MELGYRGSGEVLSREEFELRKQVAAASKQARRDQERWEICRAYWMRAIMDESYKSLGPRIVHVHAHVVLLQWVH